MRAHDDADTSSGLLREVRDSGNRQAWQRFFQRYKSSIYSYCRKRQLPCDAAVEVTQRVLIRLAHKMSRFVYDPSKSFRSWLRRMIDYEVRNFRREQIRKQRDRGSGDSKVLHLLEQVPCPDSLLEPLLDDVAATTHPLRNAVEQIQERVKSSVQPSTWEAFWLTAIEGHSTKAAAELLGMKYAAAYKNSQRVREKLRKEAEKMKLSLPE